MQQVASDQTVDVKVTETVDVRSVHVAIAYDAHKESLVPLLCNAIRSMMSRMAQIVQLR